MADELGLHFDERVNHGFRGVGRMECLEKLLGRYGRGMAGAEKVVLAERKNGYYLEMVRGLEADGCGGGGADAGDDVARERGAGGGGVGEPECAAGAGSAGGDGVV